LRCTINDPPQLYIVRRVHCSKPIEIVTPGGTVVLWLVQSPGEPPRIAVTAVPPRPMAMGSGRTISPGCEAAAGHRVALLGLAELMGQADG
jgi:hypothetical protein